jgi:hypothetical protein
MLAGIPFLGFVLIFTAFLRGRPRDDPRDILLSAALVCGVIVVAATEALSLFGLLAPPSIAVSWVAVAVGATLVAVKLKKAGRSEAARLWKPIPPVLLVILGGPIMVVALLTGLIAAVAWPNNYDVLNYHLPRVAHWAANGTVAHYPTHISHQLFYPPWAGYAVLHLTLLGGSERFANLVQWGSMLGSLIGVSLIARRLAANPPGQLFSALFCATLPMGILQASSVQNDYVTTLWLVCLVNALLAWRDQPASTGRALAVGASLGLALLTKGSAYIFAAPLLAGLLISARPYGWARYTRQAALIGLVALALNTPHYLRNLEVFGSPLGPSQISTTAQPDRRFQKTNDDLSWQILTSNLVRNVAYQLGSPLASLNSALEGAIRSWFSSFSIRLDDPKSTFLEQRFELRQSLRDKNAAGNFVHAVLIGGSLLGLVASRRRGDLFGVWSYALSLVLGLVLFSALVKWEPQNSRLLLPLFALWAPLIGLVFERHVGLLVVAALAMAIYAWPPLVQNSSHPLLGRNTVLAKPRDDQYFTRSPAADRKAQWLGATGFVRSSGCTEVGLVLNWSDLEYLFWVLLPELKELGGRIEHVSVENQTRDLEARQPLFRPCAVVSTRGESSPWREIGGRRYHRAWFDERMAVFLPADPRDDAPYVSVGAPATS